MNSEIKPIRIGITGGIGSGKSTVCKIIEKLGYPVFYSDLEAKSIMNYNSDVIEKVKLLFGESAYDEHGALNRAHLAQVAFKNPSVLASLNDIIHPAVRIAFENFSLKNSEKKLIFNEAAILFETGAYKRFDFNILVCAEMLRRIKRVCERDNISENQVLERMKNQWSDDQKIPLADFVIYNNDEALQPQVESIIREIQHLKNL